MDQEKVYKPITAGKDRAMLLQLLQRHRPDDLDGLPLVSDDDDDVNDDQTEQGSVEESGDEAYEAPKAKKARSGSRPPVRVPRDPGVQSYQIHADIKNDIADVLELIRIEAKKRPELHVQVRNRTAASITKRYLYERDIKKLQRCLEDANKIFEKYKSSTFSATQQP